MKISTLVFGGGISTLGMDVIINSIPKKHEVLRCEQQDFLSIKASDVFLVSLYWFENLLDFLKYLNDIGINPKNKKPIVVIGGVSAINIRILKGYFNYAILGDGELVIADVLDALDTGSDPSCLDGVISDGDFDSKKNLLTNPNIPANAYTELRSNRTARIELARGCRFKCPFCQLAHTKPYREQPVEIIEHLLKNVPTKSVGLFAPDRTGYSNYSRIEYLCKKLGKHNTAEDARLDMLLKYKTVNKCKFGLEGFAQRTRASFGKVKTKQKLLAGFNHVFNVLKTPKGKRITTATVYMIGDLPGEGESEVLEFWDVLKEVDELCPGKFTMFLTLNSFSPKPFTPMERSAIHPYNDWNKYWAKRPRLPKITIASRGGMLSPANRIIHAMTARGDERLARVLFYLSTEGRKIYNSRSKGAGKAVEKLIKMQGVDPNSMYEQLDDTFVLPHNNFSIQPLEK